MKSENYSLSALTAPVVAGGVSTAHGIKNVVYVAGIDGNVFGIETDTGELAWTPTFLRTPPLKSTPTRELFCARTALLLLL